MLLGPTGYPLSKDGKLATWPFALDPDHSESQGLQALAIATPFGFYDLKQELLATRSAADAFTASQYGGLDAAYNSSADGHLFPAGKALDYTQPFTIVWEAQLNSFAVNYPEICTIYGGGTNLSLLLFYSNQAGYSDLTIGKSNDVSTLQYNATMPSGVSVTGERHWGVWSYIGGGFGTTANHSCWINGQDATIPGHSGGLGAVTDQTMIGGIGSTTWWNGQIRQLRWYDRAWAKNEAIAFWHPATRDSLFVPEQRRIWAFSAGSGTTITCTVGNAGAAGPSALVNASISSTVGNASAAGVTAAVNASIAATVGNATAAGVTALVSTTIHTSTGDAAASGVAANINATIQTATGNATAAGVTATISAGGNVTITCSVGNAVASGTAALLNTSIVCSIGNAGAAGVTALIQSGVIINASVGNAVAAGITALLHKTIQTATGNAVAAGITASILGATGQQINAPRRNRSLFDSAMRRPAALSTRHRPWH